MSQLSQLIQKYLPFGQSDRNLTYLELSDLLFKKVLAEKVWLSIGGQNGILELLNQEIAKHNIRLTLENNFYHTQQISIRPCSETMVRVCLNRLVQELWLESSTLESAPVFRKKIRFLKGYTGPEARNLVYGKSIA